MTAGTPTTSDSSVACAAAASFVASMRKSSSSRVRSPEADDELLEADRSCPCRPPIEAIRKSEQDIQVTLDRLGDAGALYLHDPSRPSRSRARYVCAIEAATRGLGSKLGEDSPNGSDVGCDYGDRGFAVGRRGAFLEGHQFRRDGGSHQLWLLRHRLAELHEQTTGVLEGQPQRPAQA
jgi:hypothetical protein